jgi:hypothetical protein
MHRFAQSHSSIARNIITTCAALVLLTACGSDKIELSGNKNVNEAIDAATGPLQDLNLRKHEIPEILVKAGKNPYARPGKAKCAVVREELAQLDEVLGPDMEPMEDDDGKNELMRLANAEMPAAEEMADGAVNMAGDFARKTVMGTIRSHTDILPFRSIVRKVSGADRHAKRTAKAYEAGKLRRAYLKGFAYERFGKQCLNPPIAVEAQVDPKLTAAAQ